MNLHRLTSSMLLTKRYLTNTAGNSRGTAVPKLASTILVLACLVAIFTTGLFAQTATGTLRGKVTDPSGAVISGAIVTATSANGQKSTATTNNQGIYEFKNLPP